MPSEVMTSAGATLALSAGIPASEDSAGYGVLAWTVIGEVTDLGGLGRVYNLVTHNPIASRKTEKFKGSFNEGSQNVGLAIDRDDPGQVLAKTALASDDNYSFRLTYQDGSIDYYQAKVMSFETSVGSNDQIVSGTIAVEIDSEIAEVAANGTDI